MRARADNGLRRERADDGPVRGRADHGLRPLRVGINLLFMGERAGGVGRYARELVGALVEAEPGTEVHVLVSAAAPADLRREPWAHNVTWVTVPGSSFPLVAQLGQFAVLPAIARARRLDVLHSPGNTGPVLTPGLASVVSLHDLIWLHRGSEWDARAHVRRRMARTVRHCVRHADRVFTGSHASAEDIATTLGVSPGRIVVTPYGVTLPPAAPAALQAQVRERLALGGARVLLCVAQQRPYKNLHTLIRALAELDDDVVLVLPGSHTTHQDELRELARELGVEQRLRFPDWLTDEELDALYRLSAAFVLPSLIEGFGLPVIEAMARGLPVACSNVSALPEVAGDAALVFHPERQDEITGAVRRLLDDRELAHALAARGPARAAQFTWRRAGEASLAGYRDALAGRARRPPGAGAA